MDAFALVLLCFAVAVALVDWRKAFLLAVAVGFAQDAFRKMIPGEPLYLSALVGGVFAIVFASAMLMRKRVRLGRIYEWRARLQRPVWCFVVVVGLQAVHTFIRFDNPVLAAFGLLGYLAPLPAALLGYHYGRDPRSIRGFLFWYVLICVTAMSGVYLAFLGYEWRVLQQVGPGLIIYTQGGILEAYPGFLRSPEVAAWHAATAVCFLVILGASTRRLAAKLLIGTLVVYLIGAGLLTGRRKMLVEVVLFLAAYWFLFAYFRLGVRKVTTLVAAASLVGILFAMEVLTESQRSLAFDPYVRHGVTGFGDAPERFQMLGLGSVLWAINRHGLLGAGAGTGSQGGQYFGGGVALIGGSAEGGLGKVMTELGLPGLLVLLWLVLVMSRGIWRSMRALLGSDRELSTLCYGLVGFLGANVFTFVVASQIYGDLFVLLILGWSVGLVMRIPQLADRRWLMAASMRELIDSGGHLLSAEGDGRR